MKNFLFILLLAFAFDNSFSQRLIDRNLIINPLFSDSLSIELNSFGEFGMYRIQRDDSHSWLQKLGIVIDFYKTSDFSFSGISSIEFVSDPHNDIRFNPRAIFWDEGFFITKKINKNFLHFGYYHRCKHDVDNLFTKYERTLIYGSVTGKFILPELLSNEYENLLQIRTDIYTIKYDHKYPKIKSELSYDKLVSSVGINFKNILPMTQNINLILNSNALISFYSDNKDFVEQFVNIKSTQFNYGFNVGFGIGKDNLVKVLLNYEFISDSGIDLNFSKSKLFYFSILLANVIFK